MSLATKFSVTVVLLLSTSLGTMSFLAVTATRTSLREQILSANLTAATLAARAVERYIADAASIMREAALRPKLNQEIRNANWPEAKKVLENFLRHFAQFDYVFVQDPDGVIRVRVPHAETVGQDFSFRDFFREAKRTRRLYISGVYVSKAAQRPVVSIAMPVLDGDENVKAVLVAALSLGAMSQFVSTIREGNQGRLYIVDAKGLLIAHSGGTQAHPAQDMKDRPIVQALMAGQSGTMEFREPGGDQTLLGAHVPISSLGWGVVATQPASVAIGPAIRLSRWLLWIALGCAVVAVLIGWRLARTLTGPLLRFVEGTKKLAGGDFAIRITAESHDEVAALASSFNSMAEELQKSYQALEQKTKEAEALNEKLQARVIERTAQLDIALALGSTSKLNRVLKIVAQRTAQAVGADRCSINLWREGHLAPVMFQFADGHADPDLWAKFKAMGPYTMEEVPAHAEAIRTRQPVTISDAAADPLIPADWVETFGVRSALVVPLVHQNEVIGTLNLDQTAGPYTWRQEQIDLVMTIAGQAALAVENARLYRQATERAEKLAALGALTRLITSATESQQACTAIDRAATTLLGAKMARVWVDDPSERVLRGHGSFGIESELEQVMTDVSAIQYGSGLVGGVFESRAPEYILDIQEDSRWLNKRLAKEVGLHAYAGIPLVAGDRVVGVMSILFGERPEFTHEEKELMSLLADHAAIAIQNARLFEEAGRAAEALRESNQTLNALIQASPVAIVLLHPDGRVRMWNPAAKRIFGWSEQEVLGRPVPYVPEGRENEFRANLERALRGEVFSGVELSRQKKDGSLVEVSVSTAPLRDADGSVSGILVMLADITERKRTEEALRQREKLAAMGSLLAGVAHELNNPLSVVRGLASFLSDTLTSGPLAESVQDIDEAAARCARIVSNFLALARQQPPERGKVRLNQVVEEAVELLAYPLRVDNVEVTLELAEEVPVLWADPHQLHQVLVNLITNAHHAMRETPPPHRLTLTTRHDPAQTRVSLEVADTGPGIPPEIQQRIFEPFFTTKAPGQGTGLGLSLCHGIIESHGGTIRVDSKPDQGAVFRIELPVVAPPTVEEEPGAPELEAPIRGKTILVVDDEPKVAGLLARLLAADGHHVDTAGNGAAALDKLQGRTYDLIMSDMKMPKLDGPGLYRAVERSHSELSGRFIFLTGDTLSPETRAFLEQTGAPSLSKPFTVADVRRVVQGALGNQRGRRMPEEETHARHSGLTREEENGTAI